MNDANEDAKEVERIDIIKNRDKMYA